MKAELNRLIPRKLAANLELLIVNLQLLATFCTTRVSAKISRNHRRIAGWGWR